MSCLRCLRRVTNVVYFTFGFFKLSPCLEQNGLALDPAEFANVDS